MGEDVNDFDLDGICRECLRLVWERGSLAWKDRFADDYAAFLNVVMRYDKTRHAVSVFQSIEL